MDNSTSENSSDPALVTVDDNGKVAVVTMVHRPYNLSGPILYRALLTAFEEAVKSGCRAILLTHLSWAPTHACERTGRGI